MTDISPELLSLLTDLVAIDSVNPGLDSTGAGESPLADHLETWCGERGLALNRHGSPERPSLLISTTRGAPGPTLVLCGHLDTVGLAGMSEPLVPRIEGGRMHGRGTYDMKGGLAAALVAAARLDVPEHRGRVVVAAVADEENLSQGMEDVLASLSADAAVVTEPTELEVVTAHRGFAWLTVTAYGVAAHGSRPHLGVDAIVAMGPVLTGLAELQTTLAETAHPLLGPGTVHASLIEGGTEVSTIPDRCVLRVERRTLPGESGATVLAELDAVVDRAREAMPDARFEVTLDFQREPLETSADHPLVEAALDARGAVMGAASSPVGASFWADSALLASAGIPTILLGPIGEGAHADVEWVDLASVEQTALILCGIAERLPDL
ncbi:M20/M25/M40 family metallo-hydrolase [Nostocoides veronense]|uniref:ArgE/DapE family deacylase n=1 Tax=Nostocoides veronense TaxID=330836 RepID=A0ABP4Y726_9MICO